MDAEAGDGLRIELIERAFIEVVGDPRNLDRIVKALGLRESEVAHLRGLLDEDQSGLLRVDEPIGLAFDPPSGPSGPPELDGYSVYEDLGAGGMGVVHRAIQQSTGQTVAIKVIGREATSKAWRARFQREIAILGRLRHPGIVQILDAGTTAAGDPYFVMQLVEDGMRIDQWVERERLGWTERLDVFQQVLDAVGYLHHAGVLHRDLKPSNILVDKQGRPKVIDFGISVPETGGEYAATVVAGTPQFMSPESSASRLGVAADTRADIYSLGLVLASMFGIRPAGDPDERSKVVRSATPTPTPRRLQAFQAILARAIAPAPEHRYQSTEAFGVDLDRLVDLQPVEAAVEGLSERLLLSARRSPGVFGIAMLILIILVLVPVLSIDAARQANLEAERANRFSNWLEGTLFELVREEAVREEAGAVTRWVDMQALIDPGSPESNRDGLLAAEQLRVLGEARVFANQGDVGIRMMRDGYDMLERELGPEHPRVRHALGQLIRAVALAGYREELERLVEKARGERSPEAFARSDEFRMLFSPTLGEDDLAAELNSSLEYVLDAMAPVSQGDLMKAGFASRIAEIDALAAVGLADRSRDEANAWISQLLEQGKPDVAYRALIRVLALEKNVPGVLERFMGMEAKEWASAGYERFHLLALAVHLEEEYADEFDGQITVDLSSKVTVTGSIDRVVKELILEVWKGDVGETGSVSFLSALLALAWSTDLLEDGMHEADAVELDLECWRRLAELLGSYPSDQAARDIFDLAVRTRDATEFYELLNRWKQALDYLETTLPVANDPDQFLGLSEGTAIERLGVDFEEYMALSEIGHWISTYMVKIQDLAGASVRDRIVASYNLGVERDWMEDPACVDAYRRAFTIARDHVAEDALFDDAAVVGGLVTIEAAIRYGLDFNEVADIHHDLVVNNDYLHLFLNELQPDLGED